jgi:hypothetical protein
MRAEGERAIKEGMIREPTEQQRTTAAQAQSHCDGESAVNRIMIGYFHLSPHTTPSHA